MSTVKLPIPSFARQNSFIRHQSRPSPPGEFVKQSRNGGVCLRLIDQADGTTLPVCGCGGSVAGTVELAKTVGVARVEVKIDGRLVLKEVAEGGATTSNLCLDSILLWDQDSAAGAECPNSFSFCLLLPTTFTTLEAVYPLPPTYEAHLSGLPGFQANISYSVSAIVTRGKTTLFSVLDGQTTVSTPFIYHPLTRPAAPLPLPLTITRHGLFPNSDWRLFESTIHSKPSNNSMIGSNVTSQLFLPSSRMFCIRQPIPFHLVFKASAVSLAAFMPYGPTVCGLSQAKRPMRLQLLRQSTVNVSYALQAIQGAKTDMWRVDTIGDAMFTRMGDGSDWIAFNGELAISPQVKVGGFQAGGFHVKDCLVLSMTPSDPVKSPFASLRQVIPIRLTTDMWAPGFAGSEFSLPDDDSEPPGYAL